jgi:hypothetical protein
MANSIREQILAEIASRLVTATGANGRVYRSRAQAASKAEMPLIVVTPVKDSADRQTSIRAVDRYLTVRLAVIVRGDIPDQEADAVLQSAHKLLMPSLGNGFVDVTLGGLAIDVSQGGDSFEMAFTEGVVISDYIIQYRHMEDDLAVQGP